MREIKFRAWDTKTKKMIFTGFHVIGEVVAFNLIYQYCRENKEEDEPSLGRLCDIEIMQYTGLKDKDGVEIYEGDIVKKLDGDYCDLTGFIEWCGTCCLGYRIQYIGIGNSQLIQAPWRNTHKVIGNIYENPELMEDD